MLPSKAPCAKGGQKYCHRQTNKNNCLGKEVQLLEKFFQAKPKAIVFVASPPPPIADIQ